MSLHAAVRIGRMIKQVCNFWGAGAMESFGLQTVRLLS